MVDTVEHEPIPQESLADFLEANPETGQIIFDFINESVQEILPGSDYHERYLGASELGLAIAVVKAGDLDLGDLNPLGWSAPTGSDATSEAYYNTSQDRLSFRADNRESVSKEAWNWDRETDETALGGEITEETSAIGRFAVFATAKLNHLKDMPRAISSHWPGSKNTGEGKFGNAGAKAVGTPEAGGISLVASSGLWEVHDHIVSAVFCQAVEMAKTKQKQNYHIDRYDIAAFIHGELVAEFEKVDQILAAEGKTAAEISEDRPACNALIQMLELDYTRNAQRQAGITY